MWNPKYDTNEPIYRKQIIEIEIENFYFIEIEKDSKDSQTQRIDLWLPVGRGLQKGWSGGGNQQTQTNMYRMDKQEGSIVQHK